MKEFENEQEQMREQYHDDSCSLNHSENAFSQPQQEIESLFGRSLYKIHEWYDMNAIYVLCKEKILGKKGKTGKKNIEQWIETNELYYGLPETIKTDRDYWISAAEVVERITKAGTPVLRDKWVYSMRCHFQILSIEEASQLLGFQITYEQLKGLVLAHCRQRVLSEPIMWEDGEDLTLVWPLSEPYYKGEFNYYYDSQGEIWEDEFAFNTDWSIRQDLLYEDLKYLGARKDKKHASTMLRVPGTWNTRKNAPVLLIHDAAITTVAYISLYK